MATESSDAQVETAPAEQINTASPAPTSSATEAPSTTESQPETVADANAALAAFYDGKPTDEGTEASAQPKGGDDKQPSAEQPKVEDKDKTLPAEPPKDDPDAPDQMRPRLKNPDDIAIASIAKAKGIGLAQAADIYRGKTATDAPAAAPAPGTEASAQPSPVQTQEAKVADLQRQLDEAEAQDNYLTTDYQKLSRQFTQESNRLDLMRVQEHQADVTRQNTAARNQANAVTESEAAAVAEYPTAADGNSELGKVISAVIGEWQAAAQQNPRSAAARDLAASNAPQIAAAEAVERLSDAAFKAGKFPTMAAARASFKAPASAAAAPKTVPPTLQQPPAQQRRVTPAPGSKGQVTTGKPSTFGEVFAAVDTAEKGNEALLQMYGGPAGGRRGS